MSQSSSSPILSQSSSLPTTDSTSQEAMQLRRLRFLQDFGHSLRTPLDSLLGLTNLTLETELLPQQREYLQLMRESCESLLRTVHSALDFACLETGTISFANTAFDLKGLLGHTRHVLSQEAQAAGSELQIGLQSCIPDRAVGDGPRLQQLLTHLMQGMLAVCSGTTLQVLLEHETRCNGCFALSVTLAIPLSSMLAGQLEALQAILKQGFDLTLDAYTPGRMHLALAQLLARGMGGVLTLSTTPDGMIRLRAEVLLGEASEAQSLSERLGSLALKAEVRSDREASRAPGPALQEPASAGDLAWFEPGSVSALPPLFPSPASSDPGALTSDPAALAELAEPWDAQLRILVVEDNAVNRRLMLRLLEKKGYRVDCVGSGEEALERLQSEAYEVILMDLLLPGIDGMEAARQIRSGAWKGRVPPAIIALTAHTSQSLEKECREVGMDGFLRKPIESERLLSLLRSIAGSLREGLEAHRVRLAIDKTVLDREELLVYFHFDLGLLARTARTFFLVRHERVQSLEEWGAQGRWMPALHRAQGLRALLETFCARASVEACMRLEVALARGSLEDTRVATTALARALDRLELSMRAVLRELQQASLDPVGMEVA